MKEIKIKLKAFGYDQNSIEEFYDFCQENKIESLDMVKCNIEKIGMLCS